MTILTNEQIAEFLDWDHDILQGVWCEGGEGYYVTSPGGQTSHCWDCYEELPNWVSPKSNDWAGLFKLLPNCWDIDIQNNIHMTANAFHAVIRHRGKPTVYYEGYGNSRQEAFMVALRNLVVTGEKESDIESQS